MSVKMKVRGLTKAGVGYMISDEAVIFNSVGMNSIHKPGEVKVLRHNDIEDSSKHLFLAQVGASDNGIIVRLNENEANLFAEALGVEIIKG
ncbi:hypothetical protein [Shewanella marisflavi]|uniref:hypothetical protein n=1 Tax=Shewanella marisflavi TaxID=260364 RepID=UPI003AAACC23